jgi:hypothetical protein
MSACPCCVIKQLNAGNEALWRPFRLFATSSTYCLFRQMNPGRFIQQADKDDEDMVPDLINNFSILLNITKLNTASILHLVFDYYLNTIAILHEYYKCIFHYYILAIQYYLIPLNTT